MGSVSVAHLGRVTQCHQLTKIARGASKYFIQRGSEKGSGCGEGSDSVTNCHPGEVDTGLALGKHLKSFNSLDVSLCASSCAESKI